MPRLALCLYETFLYSAVKDTENMKLAQIHMQKELIAALEAERDLLKRKLDIALQEITILKENSE